MQARHLVVKGRVQGVGFRSFVLQTARSLGVVGETWNARDGSVNVIAQHSDENVLKLFEEKMWDGPGRVDQVRSDPVLEHGYAEFSVTASR